MDDLLPIYSIIMKLIKTLSIFALAGCLTACFRQGEGSGDSQLGLDSLALPQIDSVAIDTLERDSIPTDSLVSAPDLEIPSDSVRLGEELLYDTYNLEDEYSYRGEQRGFQWSKIKEYLALVEGLQREHATLGVLQNYKNKNGLPPLPQKYGRNKHEKAIDSLGVERSQAIPLFEEGGSIPILYARDGSLVRILRRDSLAMAHIEGISFEGAWQVPDRYVASLGDSLFIRHIAFVDVRNQNIALVEQTAEGWLVRSKNPATTGLDKPPYARPTPTGIFVLQGKREKMYYLKDGTDRIEGYAPYASRFTNGAYIHGVPVNKPNGKIIEYSATLGTTPRSHMCVRNASSHAEFVFRQAKAYESLVIVID